MDHTRCMIYARQKHVVSTKNRKSHGPKMIRGVTLHLLLNMWPHLRGFLDVETDANSLVALPVAHEFQPKTRIPTSNTVSHHVASRRLPLCSQLGQKPEQASLRHLSKLAKNGAAQFRFCPLRSRSLPAKSAGM